MNSLKTAAVLAVVLSLVGCRTSRVDAIANGRVEVFVGSTPCDSVVREFLRIPRNTAGECIRWQLNLDSSNVTGGGSYTLVTTYGMPETNGAGFFQGGTRIETTGHWKTITDNRNRKVYQLQANDSNPSLSLARIDENLLQLLTRDGQLMVGNDSWSYTLSRMASSHEVMARTAPVGVDPSTNAVLNGSKFLAQFVGRSPCSEISNEIGASVPDQCFKLKWEVTLFQDETTGAPTTYRIDATLYRRSPRLGRWKIVKGTEKDPAAIIYELEAASGHGAIRLMKADDNILFFVGQNGTLMVGNADFSYTLNRAEQKFPRN